jgi:hypothetical protein
MKNVYLKYFAASITVFALAVLLRLPMLDRIPYTLDNDRVNDMAYAFENFIHGFSLKSIVCSVNERYAIGSTTGQGFDLLLSQIAYKMFDTDFVSVRIVYAMVGIMTILLILLLYKEIFNYRVGLIAAYFIAVSFIHIFISRDGNACMSSLLYILVGLYLTMKLIKTGNLLIAAVAGFWSGCFIYFYLSSFEFILFLLLLSCYGIIFQRNRVRGNKLAIFIFAIFFAMPIINICYSTPDLIVNLKYALGKKTILGGNMKLLFEIKTMTDFMLNPLRIISLLFSGGNVVYIEKSTKLPSFNPIDLFYFVFFGPLVMLGIRYLFKSKEHNYRGIIFIFTISSVILPMFLIPLRITRILPFIITIGGICALGYISLEHNVCNKPRNRMLIKLILLFPLLLLLFTAINRYGKAQDVKTELNKNGYPTIHEYIRYKINEGCRVYICVYPNIKNWIIFFNYTEAVKRGTKEYFTFFHRHELDSYLQKVQNEQNSVVIFETPEINSVKFKKYIEFKYPDLSSNIIESPMKSKRILGDVFVINITKK